MARIMGTEGMLAGANGTGSLALSQNKSENLYLNVNSTLVDMAESMGRDIIDPLWAMNGLPDEIKPKMRPGEIIYRDVEQASAAIRDLAAAGAVLELDDPAIDDLRALAGLPPQPEMTPERMEAMARMSAIRNPVPDMGDGPDDGGDGGGAEPGEPQKAEKAYNPNQPRDPSGTQTGGRWTSASISPEQALGKDGVAAVQKAIEEERPSDEILDLLKPASEIADVQRHSMGGNETPPPGFFEQRRYAGGMTHSQALDQLEAKAMTYAGEGGPDAERRALLIIGQPAAGKSSSAEYLARTGKYAILDSDDAKAIIPEYRGGIGASAVHDESGLLAASVGDRLTANGVNIAIPTVGHSLSSIEKKIAQYEAKGYRVDLIGVSVEQNKAAQRMARRYLRTGRLINVDYFRAIDGQPDKIFAQIKAKGRVRTALIDGNGPVRGEFVRDSNIPGIPANRPLFGK
jgi:predicted ABC-type ATPase